MEPLGALVEEVYHHGRALKVYSLDYSLPLSFLCVAEI